MQLRVVLVGFLCALSGTTLGTVAEFFAFGSGKSGAAMQAALPLAWGFGALIIGLVPGLCLAAPLLPRVTNQGLRTLPGLILAGVILAVPLLAGLAARDWEASGFVTIGLPGLISAAIALLAFDIISANRRGAGITRVVVTGLVCGALVGPAICFRFASALFDSVYPYTLPGVYESGSGQFILLSCVAAGGALLIGLCLVAPLLRGIATKGLRGQRGRLLVLAVLAGPSVIVVSLLPGSLEAITDRLLLAAVTTLPAATSVALALILFHFVLIFLAPMAHSGGRGEGLPDKSSVAPKLGSRQVRADLLDPD